MFLYLFFDSLLSTCPKKNVNRKAAQGCRLSPIPDHYFRPSWLIPPCFPFPISSKTINSFEYSQYLLKLWEQPNSLSVGFRITNSLKIIISGINLKVEVKIRFISFSPSDFIQIEITENRFLVIQIARVIGKIVGIKFYLGLVNCWSGWGVK